MILGGRAEERRNITHISKNKNRFKKKEKAITEYLVLYLPSSFPSQLNTTQFDYLSNVSNMVLEFKGNSNIIKYSKKNCEEKMINICSSNEEHYSKSLNGKVYRIIELWNLQ